MAEWGCSSILTSTQGDQGGMFLGRLARRAGQWWSMGKGWFSGVWGSVILSTCSPVAELPHRLTMEMLALEKRLYSGASRSSVEGVATAANFRTWLVFEWRRLGVVSVPDCSPGRKRGGRRGCRGSAERCPLQAEVTEGASLGSPGG